MSDDPAYFGSLGELYRPRFVVGGVAVHGYRSIPNYPASHGCIRVSNGAMDMIWATNAMPMGSRSSSTTDSLSVIGPAPGRQTNSSSRIDRSAGHEAASPGWSR